jgi:3-oxoadipate enol-lactonase
VDERSGTVRVDGAELYYEAAGEGRPLVLLHDGLLDRRVWDDHFEAFAQRYRVARYDRRGYGLSSVPNRPFSDVDDLRYLLGFLGFERAHLLGMSNGGKVSLEFALSHPQMTGALVLVGPNLGGYCSSEEKLRRISAISSVAKERGVEPGVEAWMADPFYPPAIGKVAERERVRRIMTENLHRLLSTPNLRRGQDPPAIERLARIVAPTMILAGERVDPDNLDIVSILEGELPHASKKLIAGSGHLVNLEKH